MSNLPGWTAEEHAALVTMAGDGATGAEIAAALGKTRNAILGRAFRKGVKLPMDDVKAARMRKGRKPRPVREPREPKATRAPDFKRFGPNHPARQSRPWGQRAFSDDKIAIAIAARLAGASHNKAAKLIGAGAQSLVKNWMPKPELLALGQALFERAKADAAEVATVRRELEAFEAETNRLTIERINWPILGRMPERHRQILELRIAGETLQEIGDKFGVSRERIRQIEVTWKIRGLIVPGTRPVSEASLATYSHKERGERIPKPPKPPRTRKSRRPMQLSDAERARRAEHMRRVSSRRWAEARA